MEARVIRRWRRLAGAGLLGLALVAGAAPRSEIREQASTLYWWGDFEALEALYTRVARPGQWVADQGSAVGEFRGGVEDSMDGFKNVPDAFFVSQDELTLTWTRQYPQSPLAHVLHAKALVTHAWAYRGGGFANEVPPHAWAEFRRHLQRALDHLARHREVAFRISDAHAVLLGIGRTMDWNAEQLWTVAQEGLALHPDDIGLYHRVLTGLLPKWGGTAQGVDRFVQQAAEHSRVRLGEEMYARLYSSAAEEQFHHALFEDSGARWPRMKQGFEDLLKRLPSTAWRNRYAYMACLARDKPVFLEQMEQIGTDVERDRWGRNATRTIETCRRWAAQQ